MKLHIKPLGLLLYSVLPVWRRSTGIYMHALIAKISAPLVNMIKEGC